MNVKSSCFSEDWGLERLEMAQIKHDQDSDKIWENTAKF